MSEQEHTAEPMVMETKFMSEHEHRGNLELIRYIAETDILWDENTTITVRRGRPKDELEQAGTKEQAYLALGGSAERLARSLCALPAMSKRSSKLEIVLVELISACRTSAASLRTACESGKYTDTWAIDLLEKAIAMAVKVGGQ